MTQADIDCEPECVDSQKYPAAIPDNDTQLMVNFWIPNDVVQDTFGGNKRDNQYPMTTSYDWIRIYQYDAEPFQNWK